MHAAIVLSTLFSTLLFAIGDPPVLDLCADEVYLDPEGAPLEDADGTRLSVYCDWTGEDAPVWAGEVCCDLGPDSAYCTPTDTNGTCSPLQAKRWCEFGELDGDRVSCLQPFPSACKSGVCAALPLGVQVDPQASTLLCCFAGVCYEIAFQEGSCGGSFQWCDSPYTNEDGTVGCADYD